MDLWSEVIKLLKESTLIQGSVTLIVVIARVYCVVAGIDPGQAFDAFVGLVFGYYFGAKSSQQTTLALREALNNVQKVRC